MAQTAPLERIRKLYSLASSPNEHEAARAREQADELCRKWGVTERDLVGEATEEANSLGASLDGNQRPELARLVAKSRGCRAAQRQQVFAFVGRPEAAKDARQLFTALVNLVEANCELHPHPGYSDGDHFAWRTCFWLGYVSSIQRKLDPEFGDTPTEAMASIVASARDAGAPPFVQRVAQTLLRDHSPEEANSWRRSAYAAGKFLGDAVQLSPYRGPK